MSKQGRWDEDAIGTSGIVFGIQVRLKTFESESVVVGRRTAELAILQPTPTFTHLRSSGAK